MELEKKTSERAMRSERIIEEKKGGRRSFKEGKEREGLKQWYGDF